MLLPLSQHFTAMPTLTSTSTSTSISTTTTTSISPKPKKPSQNPNPNPTSLLCKHSPSATLDLLILILVLFSCTFLITSSLSYIFRSLSLLLPSFFLSLRHSSPFPCILGFLIFLVFSIAFLEICCGARSRKCDNPNCRGLKKAMEFDIQLQTEECLRSKGAREVIDLLPWKGGSEVNPDYECLRSELRRMAPANGRAVLLFMARCGCPVAKLEAWGPKRGRRHKKGLARLTLDGGDR